MKQKFILAHSTARQRAIKAVADAPAGYLVELKPPTRSLAANARMWAMLNDLSEQVVWHGQKLSADDWKTMCTASLKSQRVLPGIEGGFVVMGESTSQMTVAEMVELQDFIEAFGIQHSVTFHDEYTEAA